MTTTADRRTASEIDITEGLAALTAVSTPVGWSDQDWGLATDGSTWHIVLAGHVDVFAVALSNGEPHGAWRALGRLGRGDIIVGALSGASHQLLFRRVDDAVVVACGVEDLRDAVENVAHISGRSPTVHAIVAGLESTIRTLSANRKGALPPRDFVPIAAGERRVVGAGVHARAVDGVVWLDVRKGVVRSADEPDRDLRAGRELCLTRQEWITGSEEAEIVAWSTRDVLERGGLWRRAANHATRFLRSVDRDAARDALEVRHGIEAARARDESVLTTVREGNDAFMAGLLTRTPVVMAQVRTGYVAAVSSVLEYLHLEPDPPQSVAHRTDLDTFEAVGRSGWVRTRPVVLEGAWWRSPESPLVGEWAGAGPVAFLPAEQGYLAHGAGLPRPVRVTAENHIKAGRTAYDVYPTPPREVRTVGALLMRSLSGLRQERWLLVLMSILVGALSLATPVFNGQILGSYVELADRDMIVQCGMLVIVAALATAVFSAVQQLVVLRIQGAVTATTQAGVWTRLLRLPVDFFQRFPAGRLAIIVLGVKAAQQMIVGMLGTVLLSAVVAVTNLAVMYWYSVPLAAAGSFLAVVAVGVALVIGRSVVRHERRRYLHDQNLHALAFEILSAMPKIRAAAAEERAFLRWAGQLRVTQGEALESRRLQDRMIAFAAVYPIVCLAVLAFVAKLQPGLGIPALLTVLTAQNLMMGAILQIAGAALAVCGIVPLLNSVEPVLRAAAECGPDKAHPGDLSGRISLRGLSFRYGTDGPLVLDSVNLEVAPGEFIAIVGPSGSGKSTIIRLVLGFEQPLAGSILYDGQDLAELDLSAVRAHCGVVLQTGALMPGDIRDNIAGGGSYPEEDIWEAAEMAGVADDIRALPMGLATVVSEGNQGLSGGQMQRLMIARALVNRPRIVIFDEATSALDNPTQRIVAEATRRLNATRVVVAHRLSTVRDADRIIVLDRGSVVQEGSYEQLMEDREGLFYQLAQRQGAAT